MLRFLLIFQAQFLVLQSQISLFYQVFDNVKFPFLQHQGFCIYSILPHLSSLLTHSSITNLNEGGLS